MPTFRNTLRPLAAGLTALVMVAGCTPDQEPEPTRPPRTAPVAAQSDPPSDPADGPAKASAPDDPATSPDLRDDDLATCLGGTWSADVETAAAGFGPLIASTGDLVSASATGRIFVTYDGRELTSTHEGLALDYTLFDEEVGTYTVRYRSNGREALAYSVAGDEISVVDGRNVDRTEEYVATIDGVETNLIPDAPAGDVPQELAFPNQVWRATCSPETLEITTVSIGGWPQDGGSTTVMTRE